MVAILVHTKLPPCMHGWFEAHSLHFPLRVALGDGRVRKMAEEMRAEFMMVDRDILDRLCANRPHQVSGILLQPFFPDLVCLLTGYSVRCCSHQFQTHGCHWVQDVSKFFIIRFCELSSSFAQDQRRRRRRSLFGFYWMRFRSDGCLIPGSWGWGRLVSRTL